MHSPTQEAHVQCKVRFIPEEATPWVYSLLHAVCREAPPPPLTPPSHGSRTCQWCESTENYDGEGLGISWTFSQVHEHSLQATFASRMLQDCSRSDRAQKHEGFAAV